MRASSNLIPKKDKFPSPGEAGTELLNSSLPSLPKYLDERARLAVVTRRAKRAAAVRLVDICEHCAEASDCCRGIAIGTRYGEGRFGDVAPHRSEQPRPAERPEDFAIARIAKKHRQAALRAARRRSLRKPQPGCFVLAASGVQEHEERIYRGSGIQQVRVAPIPIDLAPTLLDRAWIIEVVVPQRRAEFIDCALNGGSVWSGGLKYQWRGLIGLCLCSPTNCEHHQKHAKGGYDGRTDV